MTQVVDRICDAANAVDAIVFDQWGVLHDGTSPYPGVPQAVADLARTHRLGVLSNSGKRAAANAARIADKGYPVALFHTILTSGETFWKTCAAGHDPGPVLAITAAPGDAVAWADGLDIIWAADVANAATVLLMGLPEGSDGASARRTLTAALRRDLPLVCTNPDRASPRADGQQTSPGALAHAYADAGGRVTFYGKPHGPVFHAMRDALDLPPNRILMVGDSLEHDIAGAQAAGWKTCFVRGGLHRDAFGSGDPLPALLTLVSAAGVAMPDFTLFHSRT